MCSMKTNLISAAVVLGLLFCFANAKFNEDNALNDENKEIRGHLFHHNLMRSAHQPPNEGRLPPHAPGGGPPQTQPGGQIISRFARSPQAEGPPEMMNASSSGQPPCGPPPHWKSHGPRGPHGPPQPPTEQETPDTDSQ